METIDEAVKNAGYKIGDEIMIDLDCEAEVPGLDADKFAQYAQTAKEKCPISRLFAGTEINLSAKLIG